MNPSNSLVRLIIRSLILSVLVPGFALASTYYVDNGHPSASDTNPGTESLPWLTIQHATETLTAGDTVFIKDGVYNEHVYPENSGNASNHIVYSAYPGDDPILDGTGVTESQNGIIVTQHYIKLLGLEIRNWEENAIWVEQAAYVEISDCEIHDVFYGIGIADGTHDFEINRCVLHHFDLYGIDVDPQGGADCYNGTFNDCTAHTGRDPGQNVDGFALAHGTQHDFELNRCVAYGVFDGFDISAPNSTLDHCAAYNCWNSGFKLWADHVTLTDCLSYHNVSANVELDWGDEGPGRTTLMNCTFMDAEPKNKTYGSRTQPTPSSCTAASWQEVTTTA